jgi:hypothetical protein
LSSPCRQTPWTNELPCERIGPVMVNCQLRASSRRNPAQKSIFARFCAANLLQYGTRCVAMTVGEGNEEQMRDALRCGRLRRGRTSIQLEGKSIRRWRKNGSQIHGGPLILGRQLRSRPGQQRQDGGHASGQSLQLVGFDQSGRCGIDVVGRGDHREQQADQTQHRHRGNRAATVHFAAKHVNTTDEQQTQRDAGPNEIENCFQGSSTSITERQRPFKSRGC